MESFSVMSRSRSQGAEVTIVTGDVCHVMKRAHTHTSEVHACTHI